MKRLPPNKYRPKHRGMPAFHPGNIVVAPVENDKIPSYHSSGLKTYVRKFPPARNEKLINVPLLCVLLKQITPQNAVSGLSDGIVINERTMTLSEGLAVVDQKLKFRFADLKDLLSNLVLEGILAANKHDVKDIKFRYYEVLKENE